MSALNKAMSISLAVFISLGMLFLPAAFISAIGQQCCDTRVPCPNAIVTGETCECDDKCEASEGVITKAPGICVFKESNEDFICPWTKYFDIDDLLKDITNWIFYFAVIFLPLMILVGGLMFTSSAGDAKRYNLGKSIMIWSVVGLAFILFSKGMYTIMKSILAPAP